MNRKLKPRTPKNLFLEEGRQLIRKFNCQGCHIIENQGGAIRPTVEAWLMNFEGKSAAEAGAQMSSFSPPNLVGQGKKVQSDWFYHFLENPSIIRPWLKVKMPKFTMTENERNALVRYFSYLDEEQFPFVNHPPVLEKATLEVGKKLMSADYFDCFNCHIQGDKMPQGTPDRWAPDLGLSKARLKPEWIIQWIKDPQKLLPGTNMPTFFDPEYFNDSGPDDLLDGDENKHISAMRDYILSLGSN